MSYQLAKMYVTVAADTNPLQSGILDAKKSAEDWQRDARGRFLTKLAIDLTPFQAGIDKAMPMTTALKGSLKAAAEEAKKIEKDRIDALAEAARKAAVQTGRMQAAARGVVSALRQLVSIDLSSLLSPASLLATMFESLVSSVKGFMDYQDKWAMTSARIGAMGLDVDSTVRSMKELTEQTRRMGESMSDASALTDRAMKAAQGDPEKMKQYRNNALALSNIMGGDLQRGMMLADRAASGGLDHVAMYLRTEPRLRAMFQNAKTDAERRIVYNKILAEGTAMQEAKAGTYGAQITRLKDSFTDLSREMGRTFGPAIIDGLQFVMAAFRIAIDLSRRLISGIKGIALNADGSAKPWVKVVAAIAAVVSIVAAMTVAWTAATIVVGFFWGAVFSPIGLIAAAIVGLIAWIGDMTGAFDGTGSAIDKLKYAWNRVVVTFENGKDVGELLWLSLKSGVANFGGAIQDVWDNIVGFMSWLMSDFINNFKMICSVAGSFWKAITEDTDKDIDAHINKAKEYGEKAQELWFDGVNENDERKKKEAKRFFALQKAEMEIANRNLDNSGMKQFNDSVDALKAALPKFKSVGGTDRTNPEDAARIAAIKADFARKIAERDAGGDAPIGDKGNQDGLVGEGGHKNSKTGDVLAVFKALQSEAFSQKSEARTIADKAEDQRKEALDVTKRMEELLKKVDLKKEPEGERWVNGRHVTWGQLNR